MRKSWTDTSFRNKNKDFNFTLSKNNFIVNATTSFVSSDFIIAQTISAENIIYNDISFNNISLNTLNANDITTTNLTANNTSATHIEACVISSNILNAHDISSTTINAVNLTVTKVILDDLDVSNLMIETIIATDTITSLGDVIIPSVTSLNEVYERNGVQDISIGLIQGQINSETSRNETQDTSINNLILDVSTINAKDFIQDGSIISLDISLVALANINKIQDISIGILDINFSNLNNKDENQDISINKLILDISLINATDIIQDISISLIQTQINDEISRNETQDTSINNLILDVSLINAKDFIQDSSIVSLGNSLVSLTNINETQDASINLLNNSFSTVSTETLNGPTDITINGNIANTILQGSFSFSSAITLEPGTSTNFIKQITNISSTKPITINGLFTENGSDSNSRGIDYRLKLKWNGSIWQILDDNYFINNSNTSIYTLRKVGINNQNPQYDLDVSGGTIRCQTFIQTSDARLKENVIIIDDALNKLLEMRGVYFNYLNNPTAREIGFIAQEVESIFPELVSTAGDGMKSLKYQNVTAILVEAIKELQDKYNRLLDDYNVLCSKINL